MQQTTVGSILRITQAYCLQLCEKETLDFGIVYYNASFDSLPDVNQFREVLIQDVSNIPRAIEQAQKWFSEHNLTCHRWVPADGQETRELTTHLTALGFERKQFVAMALASWGKDETNGHKDVRILPARAMRSAYRETLSSSYAQYDGKLKDLAIEAAETRLDDPQYDMFVATVNQKPAGRCALYQVGDIARVMDVFVDPAFADFCVHDALLAHVLAMAKRLTMQHVYVLIEENATLQTWYEKLGFVTDGKIIEYQRSISIHAKTSADHS